MMSSRREEIAGQMVLNLYSIQDIGMVNSPCVSVVTISPPCRCLLHLETQATGLMGLSFNLYALYKHRHPPFNGPRATKVIFSFKPSPFQILVRGKERDSSTLS